MEKSFQGDILRKLKLGAFYTPQELSKKMVNLCGQIKDKTIFDPCVGSGNLLIEALNKKVEEGETKEKSILEVYGCEIDKNALDICFQNLKEWYGQELPKEVFDHFVCMDFLKFNPITYWDENGKIIKK